MALPVREGVSPITRIHEEIDRMFNEFPMPGFWSWREPLAFGRHAGRMPALDLYEKDHNLVVEAELPGVERKDVRISYTDNTISIRAEGRKEHEEKREGYYRAERHYGSLFRAVPLPKPVDFSKAGAEFKDGVLTVTLPLATKAEERERTIPIGA